MRGKKEKSLWMTLHQLEVLDSIAKHGRSGVPLWFTDISLSTIRALSKRGFVDTRSRGRLIATRAGKRRLKQAWPPASSVGDQKGRQSTIGSNVTEIAPVASGEGSAGEVLTGQGD